MQDPTEKRKLVLVAAIRTISTAIRHLYEEDIEKAKAAGDVLAVVRLKAKLKKDWDAWTTPLVTALDECEKPPAIIMPADAH